jgi:inner membrane transporter RhtA
LNTRAGARGGVASTSAVLVAVLALILGMISVQLGASIAKSLFPVAGPSGTVALRVGFGTLILCGALRPWRVRVPPGSRASIVVYGIALGVMNMLFYQALSRLPLGVAVALEFTGPLAVALFFSRRALDMFWVLLAVAGLALLLPVLRIQQGIDAGGALYALGAGGCWALYIVFGQKAGMAHGAQSVALGSLISAVLVVPIGLLTAPAGLYSAPVLLPGLAIAILSTALPYLLDMVALTRLPARSFGVLMSIEPAIAAMTGLLFLDERLSMRQWCAIALIILASVGVTAAGGGRMPAPIPD